MSLDEEKNDVNANEGDKFECLNDKEKLSSLGGK